MCDLLAVDVKDGVPLAPPAFESGLDLEEVPDVVPAALDVEDRMQPALDWVAPTPRSVQPAQFPGILRVFLVVDAVGHAPGVVMVAVVGKDKAGSRRERHRQNAHV